MRARNHSFAPATDSGSSGVVVAASMPRSPAIESAAARNHASYSVLASTTRMARSPRAPLARRSRSGANCPGQSLSASSKIRMHPPVPACRAASSTARSSSPGLQHLLALDSDRSVESHGEARRHACGDPPKQNRNSFDLAVAFDNGRDGGHGSGLEAEQLELFRRHARDLRVRRKLPHSEEFAGGVEVIVQHRTVGLVQRTDATLAVLRDDGKD